MTQEKIINFISKERFLPYLLKYENNFDKTIQHYKANISISEALYPLISILEVSLRNKIHHHLIKKYNTDEWFEHQDFIMTASSFQIRRITEARNSILRKKKTVSSGRIIAELTFGFWTSLFDTKYEKILWKQLRLCFINCPKEKRKRKAMSSKFNGIRKLRNRIFHHESISWNIEALKSYIDDIIETISWLDKDLLLWSKDIFRINKVINQEKNKLI